MSDDRDAVLIAYDGSGPAREAIEAAGRLFPGAPAVVVNAWLSVRAAARAARTAMPQAMIDEAVRNLDAEAEAEAVAVAEEGAELARAAGLEASALAVRADPSVWSAIVDLAEDRQSRAVVVGSRGRSGIRSALLGSVSNAVVHRCRRPVVVVHPSDEPDVEGASVE